MWWGIKVRDTVVLGITLDLLGDGLRCRTLRNYSFVLYIKVWANAHKRWIPGWIKFKFIDWLFLISNSNGCCCCCCLLVCLASQASYRVQSCLSIHLGRCFLDWMVERMAFSRCWCILGFPSGQFQSLACMIGAKMVRYAIACVSLEDCWPFVPPTDTQPFVGVFLQIRSVATGDDSDLWVRVNDTLFQL